MDQININEKLPAAFLDRMKEQLGTQYEAFLESYFRERTYGLRYNPLKIGKEKFLMEMPYTLREVPWAGEGFYYDASAQPGKSILHEAGAFYIQEPSAMAVVSVLDPKPYERILDLCAAPGGKSTQIAGRMQGKGLLVSNEVIPNRAKILSQNIERMGIANCVVCKETPERIAAAFPGFFDRVLVDAPCSGEGMFRKDDTAIREWSPENVAMCAARQQDILNQAALALRPGGVLVYSTCTFSVQENEEVISSFIRAHPDFVIEDAKEEIAIDGLRTKEKTVIDGSGTEKMIRLWPHRIEGEGHFIARVRKNDGAETQAYKSVTEEVPPIRKRDRADMCDIFLRQELEMTEAGKEALFEKHTLFNFGKALYLIPEEMIPLQGLQIERPGLQLGFCKKDRFEPSHALALFLHPEYVGRHYELTKEQAVCYLRGETFAVDFTLKGWYLLSVQGCSIGFGKAGNGQMKNHYPKGLRRGL